MSSSPIAATWTIEIGPGHVLFNAFSTQLFDDDSFVICAGALVLETEVFVVYDSDDYTTVAAWQLAADGMEPIADTSELFCGPG